VSTALVTVVTVVALVLAALGGLSTLTRRRIGLAHLGAAALLEGLLLAQAAIAVVRLGGGHEVEDAPTFLSYLGAVVLVPVAGVLWARTETSRWAGTVVGVAALVVAVMVWRLLQLWEVPVG
jgi:hypothetical protein